jgi:hypothetical protein
MKKTLILLFILVFSISFWGCNKEESYADCDKEIQEVLAQYGEPSIEQHATSENTSSASYVFGELFSDTVVSYTFTWGKGYKECQITVETSYSNFN